MAGTPTARLKLPIPAESDPADVPVDLGKLAQALDDGTGGLGAGSGVAIDGQGTFSQRPAAGVKGRYFYATDTTVLYRDTGTAWVAWTPSITARAFLTAAQNAAANTWNSIAFDTVTFDSNGAFNTSLHGFVVPIPGNYHVNVAVSLSQVTAPNGAIAIIGRGTVGVNTMIAYGTRVQSASLSGSVGVTASDIVPASAGDLLWGGLYNLGGVNAIDVGSNNTYMSIARA